MLKKEGWYTVVGHLMRAGLHQVTGRGTYDATRRPSEGGYSHVTAKRLAAGKDLVVSIV